MNRNNYIHYLPFIFIVVFWFLWSRWRERRIKALEAKASKPEEYEKFKGYSRGVAYVFAGWVLQLSVAIFWSRIPPGNDALMAILMIVGLAIIGFGIYKFYRYRGEL
jgi:uncharacterized membrane protein